MDDLLRRNEATVKKQTEAKQAADAEKARTDAIQTQGQTAFAELAGRVKAIVEDFNTRSTAGRIGVKDVRGDWWEFTMPNTGNVLTLKSKIDTTPTPKEIKKRHCRVMATLAVGRNGQGIHFLLMEAKDSAGAGEWVAVRVKQSAFATDGRRKAEPFITTIDEIAVGAQAICVIVPDFSEDVDGAIREMIGYGLSA